MTDPASTPTAALDPAFAARPGWAGNEVGGPGTDRVGVGGVLLDPFTEAQVVAHIMVALERGEEVTWSRRTSTSAGPPPATPPCVR